MKVIKADLSSSGLNSLYKEVREYQGALVRRCNSFVKMLVEEGVRYAKALVPVDTGQTLMSIEGSYDPSSNKGEIWSTRSMPFSSSLVRVLSECRTLIQTREIGFMTRITTGSLAGGIR